MYSSGLRVYLLDYYNLLDFIVLSLYLASYMLRFLVDRWIKQADRHYNGTERAREALFSQNYSGYDLIQQQIFDDSSDISQSYFMKARMSLTRLWSLCVSVAESGTNRYWESDIELTAGKPYGLIGNSSSSSFICKNKYNDSKFVQDQQGSKSTYGDPKKPTKNQGMFRHTQSTDIR